jgi:hypothetical protein
MVYLPELMHSCVGVIIFGFHLLFLVCYMQAKLTELRKFLFTLLGIKQVDIQSYFR